MTSQPALFEGYETVRRPDASDAALMLLTDVAWIIDHGYYTDPGAPNLGYHQATVTHCVDNGWLLRHDLDDPDTEGGRRRLLITPHGRRQLTLSDTWNDHHGWSRLSSLLGYAQEVPC
jgi:hypothetical protein